MLTDFERRVSDALVAAPPGVDATGLADRARRRWRRRRLRGIGVAGVAVVVVGIPAGAMLPRIEPDREPPQVVPATTDPSPEVPGVPAGWQRVTWRDLEAYVPADWRDGSRAAWCANGGSALDARVERPGQPRHDIRCVRPNYSYGITLGNDASAARLAYPSGQVWRYQAGDVEMYESGSWLGYWYDAERMVWVNADDRETVERILATVRRLP
ncbi:hypothetical protein GCM10027062_19870 [Nocardioides hungaricus]